MSLSRENGLGWRLQVTKACFWLAQFANTALGQGVKTCRAVRSCWVLSGSAATWGEDQSAHSLLHTSGLGSKYTQYSSPRGTSRRGRETATASSQPRPDLPGAI